MAKPRTENRPSRRVSDRELKAIAGGSAEVEIVGHPTFVVTAEDHLYQMLAKELLEYRARWEDRP